MKMSTYGQYCPIAQALDIIGDRWTLLIIRDMLTGTRHFNDLQRGLPGLSRALLSKRLQQLQRDGIIEKRMTHYGRRTSEYHLTEAGIDLHNVINSLLVWGTKWSFGDPVEEQLDPLLLMWWMRGRVNRENLPDSRITIQFDFHSPLTDSYWLVISREDVVICVTDPGFDINVLVTANLKSFFMVWLGRMAYQDAIRCEDVIVESIPVFEQAFPTWFAWSPAAVVVSSMQKH